VLLRELKKENGKNVFTFQDISNIFNLNHRQDTDNFCRLFKACDEDFLSYLQGKIKLEAAFPIIEKQVLEMPLLLIREQYDMFSEEYPQYEMSFVTFQKYFSRIDSKKLKKRYDELISYRKCRIDKERFLKEILAEENLSNKTRKKIISIFPELQQGEKEVKNEISFNKDLESYTKFFLIMFLVGCNMNFEPLAMLFDVCKTTIHNWFYKLPFLKRKIIDSIKWWSGIISVDEKWVKINSKWHFVLSIVDNVTGFPLYFMVVSDIKADTWKMFFQGFYRLYGKPKLIISDGSPSLAAGRRAVFLSVPHQLCKFHKLKNLIRNIYLSYENPEKHKRMIRLAKNIFENTTPFGRKRAARKLMEISPVKVSKYIKKNILGNWKNLTKSLTSNAAERWNKKIEKVIAKRYGLKSEKFVDQLITSLWLKEAIRDKRHFEKCFIHKFDLPKECQDTIKMCNITKAIAANLLKKVG